MHKDERIGKYQKASLTVEAALVLPVFLYFMLAFLYFIRIFILQEQIQSALTKMGLNLSKAAYVFQDFPSAEDIPSFDFTVFDQNFDFSLENLADSTVSSNVLKIYAKKYLDTDQINKSLIKSGFDGIRFDGSGLFSSEDYIDIIVSYQVAIPIKIFLMKDMPFVQRVRLHKWTGYDVAAVYQEEESDKGTDKETEDSTVYVTATGSVYHKDQNCSHIKLSVTSVQGVPTGYHNDYGAGYSPCETCCGGNESSFGTYYITSDGTKYHSRRDCPKIKRSVRAIKLSEVGSRTPCKRCSKNAFTEESNLK